MSWNMCCHIKNGRKHTHTHAQKPFKACVLKIFQTIQPDNSSCQSHVIKCKSRQARSGALDFSKDWNCVYKIAHTYHHRSKHYWSLLIVLIIRLCTVMSDEWCLTLKSQDGKCGPPGKTGHRKSVPQRAKVKCGVKAFPISPWTQRQYT